MVSIAISELRERRGLTVKEAAALVGVSPKMFYNWESGVTKPSIDYIMPLCKVLNVSVDYFLNYGKMSFEEFTEKYNTTVSVVQAMERNTANKDYILWLFNAADVDVDCLIMIATAYSLMQPKQRHNVAAVTWTCFRDALAQGKVANKKIAERLKKSEKIFFDLLHKLGKEEKNI